MVLVLEVALKQKKISWSKCAKLVGTFSLLDLEKGGLFFISLRICLESTL